MDPIDRRGVAFSPTDSERGHSERLLKSDLTVSVEDGVVTLTGQVPNIWTKEKVVEIALEVPDTKEVLGELSIATGESDQELAKQIADKIRRYSFYTI